MQGVIEVPVWLALIGGFAAVVAILDRVLAPSIRWWLRRRLYRAVDDLNKRLQTKIQPFKLMRRSALIDRLSHDPEVMAAAEDHIAETGMPRDLVHAQVQRYAQETVPSFSAHMYFGVGARISRWISRSLYRVRLGAFDQETLGGVDRDATIIFVMNHRSNVDYLLVTYLAAEASALSYAVGEWARVWPLSRVIRAMGAYFVRRKSRDALYRSVLKRYVQMATEGGVTQAMFPEGGLSRDGRLGAPKLGLISYIVSGFDPEAERDVVFVPVGMNYDRVLEDRLLLRAVGSAESGDRSAKNRARFDVSLWTSLQFVFGYYAGRLIGRTHKFGYACVSFGAPLSLKAFMGTAREDHVAALGEELTRRIGAVIPILPVSLVAMELLEADAPLPFETLRNRAVARAQKMQAAGAHLHLPRDDFDYGVKVGLRTLTLRHILTETEAGYALAEAERQLLAYYANAISHLDPGFQATD